MSKVCVSTTFTCNWVSFVELLELKMMHKFALFFYVFSSF